MKSSRIASIAGALGGLIWVAAAVLGWSGDAEPTAYLAGLGLVMLSLAALGWALVATAPFWLRLVVMLATPSLGYMMWSTTVQAFPSDHAPVLVGGVLMLMGGLIGMGRSGRQAQTAAPVHGRRAAR